MNLSRVSLKHILEWSQTEGGKVVWASWLEKMSQQLREVSPERKSWDTLSEADHELDIVIAQQVAMSFISYLRDQVE